MRKIERSYEFREKLLTIHQENLRDVSCLPEENELVITDGFIVDISQATGDVVLAAAKDFQDYMLLSMGVSVLLVRKEMKQETGCIRVLLDPLGKSLNLANGYMGYKLIVEDSITIIAHDERGAAQAFYYLEDLITLRKAPFTIKVVKGYNHTFSQTLRNKLMWGIDKRD